MKRTYFFFTLLLPILLLLLLGGSSEVFRPQKKAGILADISSHQGEINWKRVQGSGVLGVYHKLSEGEDFRDPRWTKERRGELRSVGLPWGLYHFLRPSRRPAEREARWFVRESEGKWGRLLPAVDIETTTLSRKGTGRYLADFIRSMRRMGTGRMLLYSSPAWWRSHVALVPALRRELRSLDAWVAHWGVRYPDPLEGIAGWGLHQYTAKGRLPGIRGGVDLNRTRNFSRLLRKSG